MWFLIFTLIRKAMSHPWTSFGRALGFDEAAKKSGQTPAFYAGFPRSQCVAVKCGRPFNSNSRHERSCLNQAVQTPQARSQSLISR